VTAVALAIYDQAHFSKEFKKMTEHSPREFSLKISNEFGRRPSLRWDFPFLLYVKRNASAANTVSGLIRTLHFVQGRNGQKRFLIE
jgi:hypothetical protein